MDPQNTVSQPTPVVSTPVQPTVPPPPVQEKKSKKLVWIIVGIIVLLIGVGIGLLFKHFSVR